MPQHRVDVEQTHSKPENLCRRMMTLFEERQPDVFTVTRHGGQLDYERHSRKMTGAEWRAEAQRALLALRHSRKFSGISDVGGQ